MSTNNGLISWVLGFAARLRHPQLLLFVLILLVIDLIVPDIIPFLDELVLGLIALFLSRRKKKTGGPSPAYSQGNVIEGEVVDRKPKLPKSASQLSHTRSRNVDDE